MGEMLRYLLVAAFFVIVEGYAYWRIKPNSRLLKTDCNEFARRRGCLIENIPASVPSRRIE